MAERRPIRSSSRFNSEQPNPNPLEGPSRRSKRIQGQESSDTEQVGSAAQSTRGSSAASGLGSRARVPRKLAPREDLQRLSTLAETSTFDEANIDPNLEPHASEFSAVIHAKEENSGDRYGGDIAQQLREASSASAVTAQTSFSQQELDKLDPNSMLDALPDLYDAANKVIGLVVSAGATRQVEDLDDQRLMKNLARLGGAHGVQKAEFGNENELFINPEIAIRGIFEVPTLEDLVQGWVGPLAVFYKSNLASLVFKILCSGLDVRKHAIAKMELDFAGLFLKELNYPGRVVHINELNGSSNLRADTLRLALDIRTQYCVSLLNQNLVGHDYDPHEIIRQCFFEEHEEVNLKGWATKGLRSEDFQLPEKRLLQERIEAIRRLFDDMSQVDTEITLRRLNLEYSWSGLQAQILRWTELRNTEIEEEMAFLGGINRIQTAIENERTQRALEDRTGDIDVEPNNGPPLDLRYSPSIISHPPTESIEPDSSSRRKINLHSNPNALKLLLHQKTAEAALRRVSDQRTAGNGMADPLSITHGSPDQPWQPDTIDDEQFPQQIRNPLSELSQSHEIGIAEQNKENAPEFVQPGSALRARLIDHQPGAMRVSFDTQESAHPGPSTQRDFGYPDQVGNDIGSDSIEPSQDEGFQTDLRPGFQQAPVVNMRRDGEEATLTRAKKRPRTSRSTPRARTATPLTRTTPQEPPLDLVPGTQAELYAQVNSQSRLRASQIVKPRKAKEPWTNDEINALVEYISQWGFLCGKIKEVDRLGQKRLLRRDNVALKDKARNMKMDYLRGQIALPLNFDEVPLNKALDQRLRDAGIEPPPVVKRGGDIDA